MTEPDHDRRVLDTATNIEDVKQKDVLVWYSCYGSNLSEERFNCYLRGGHVKGMSRPCVGARDPTPAEKSLVLWMPYRVFFAHAMNSAWGYGGVAMLDVTPNRMHKSFMRLYKVTLQQFNDVIAQENGIKPPLPAARWLTCEQLEQFRLQESGCLRLQFESGIYPAVAYLGEQEGLPILTFTCMTEMTNDFLRGQLPAIPPADNYLAVLQRGLEESGMNEMEDYWKDIVEKQFGNFLPN